MKAYWDSSALVEATGDIRLRARLRSERGITRTHSLAEIFSALTGGNLNIRMDADGAAQVVDNLTADLDFIDLKPDEVTRALKEAKQRGVRGGRVHDFLHQLRPRSGELRICSRLMKTTSSISSIQ